jgi:branched-subunit amino acid aminotransferase/4-amino-4-deoxychorismate lyase
MTSTILINGHPSDGRIAVTDSSVLRGDGCFEVLKAYGGRLFALAEHLERLVASAAALRIELPETSQIEQWIAGVAAECGDCVVRVIVTRGPAISDDAPEPEVIVFAHDWDREPGPARLGLVRAPWHAAGVDWDLAGAKTLSYAPNMAATRNAKSSGFDDALLLTTDDIVLEGPTFSVAWVLDGLIETPSLDLGILDSITRRVVLEDARANGMDVVEGAWPLDRVREATEVMALSTVREVQPVSAVGEWSFLEGPVTSDLARLFGRRVAGID